jgi:hypothetical protein
VLVGLMGAALGVTALAGSSGHVLPLEARGLWNDGTSVAFGSRSLVVGHHADPALLRDLAIRADAAGRTVSQVLNRPLRPVVLVPATTAEAARLVGAASLDGLAALADGQRVVVVPGAFARLTATGRDVVLAHELTHVAAVTDGVPVWLREGLADYVGYRDSGLSTEVAAAELAAEVREGRLPRELPPPSAFAPGQVRLAQVYQEAWLACRLIAERFGEPALVKLYGEVREHGLDGALTTLGLSVASLTADWRQYVRKELT